MTSWDLGTLRYMKMLVVCCASCIDDVEVIKSDCSENEKSGFVTQRAPIGAKIRISSFYSNISWTSDPEMEPETKWSGKKEMMWKERAFIKGTIHTQIQPHIRI